MSQLTGTKRSFAPQNKKEDSNGDDMQPSAAKRQKLIHESSQAAKRAAKRQSHLALINSHPAFKGELDAYIIPLHNYSHYSSYTIPT